MELFFIPPHEAAFFNPMAESPAYHPRLRILKGREIAMGPGKADLLSHVQETGSLSKAARRMKMSYMKAWLLVQVMNRSYKKPLVEAERGGTGGGGATLTPFGHQVLDLYRTMEQTSRDATQAHWKRMRALLKA